MRERELLYVLPSGELLERDGRNARDLGTDTVRAIHRQAKELMHRHHAMRLDGYRFRVALPARLPMARMDGGIPSHISLNTVSVEITHRDPRRAIRDQAIAFHEMMNLQVGAQMRPQALAEAARAFGLDTGLFRKPAPRKPAPRKAAPAPQPAPQPAASSGFKWRDSNHFCARLERHGFERLAGGHFSQVFARPGADRVVKVCRKMDGWVEYIMWAAQCGFLGTFAPLVHSLHVITDSKGNDFYVAVVERLSCTLNSVMYDQLKRAQYTKALRLYETVRLSDSRLAPYQTAKSTAPRWAVFSAAFMAEFSGSPLDMHSENWMVRFDGSLVLTDPVADSSSRRSTTTPKRLRTRDWSQLGVA